MYVGLDPAKPGFGNRSTEIQLDKSDANFVDIIHTTGGTLAIFRPLGHCDSYANGGIPHQPGCEGTIPELIGRLIYLFFFFRY